MDDDEFKWPSGLFRPGKQAAAEPNLDCINTGIRRGEARVGDVRKAGLSAPAVLPAEEVQAERTARGEIHPGRSGGHLMVRK